jgi:trigger factor
MQITIQDISPVEKRVDFELPWADVAPRLDRAYNDLRRKVKLSGFRPGKAPRPVLEKLYGPSVQDDVARELVEASIVQAIREKQLEPVAPPNVDRIDLRAGQPFKFSARVEVRSQVEPKDYSGIPIERRAPKVTDEDVTSQLEQYQRQLTNFVSVEGRDVSQPSDILMVEVQGRVGEHKIKRESAGIDLADDVRGPLPGLAEKLRGVSIVPGTKHELKYNIAADAQPAELQGKEVSLTVTIKEARERRVPAVDDEMAKDTGEAESLDELKKKIRERLIDADQKRIKNELHQALVKELVKRNPFPIAKALVDRFAEGLVERGRMQLQMMGVDTRGFDPERMKADFKDEAEQEARGSVLLRAIAEREGIDVTDADIQKRVAELAAARQTSAKKLRADLEANDQLNGLRAQIREEKTLDKLLTEAKITEADPDRLIVTPQEARKAGGKLILTPEEAREEAERAEASGQDK